MNQLKEEHMFTSGGANCFQKPGIHLNILDDSRVTRISSILNAHQHYAPLHTIVSPVDPVPSIYAYLIIL